MSSIKRNFLYNSAYQLLNILIPLITTPYLTRTLGAEGIGVYSYSYSIAHYFGIFILLGLNTYGCREIAKVRDDNLATSKNFWCIYFLQAGLGAFITALYIVYCIVIAENQEPAVALSLYVLSVALDINWFFFGLEEFRFTTIRNFAIKLLKTVAIFLFVKEKDDAIVYCLIMSVGFAVSAMILWPRLLRCVTFVKPALKDVITHIKPNLLLFGTTISVVMFKYMDKVMLGSMSSLEQLGFYESAEHIISVPTSFITALGTVMLPRMSNSVAIRKNDNHNFLQNSVVFAMFLSSSLCFGIMGVSKEFVPLFYGKGYETCISLYLILLPSCVFLAFANVIRTQYLLPHGMDRVYLKSAIIAAACNITINALLIHRYGAVGTAIGTLIAEIVVCIYQTSKVRKEIPVSKYVYISLPMIVSGFIMFGVVFNIDVNKANLLLALLLKIIIGVVIYFAVLIVTSTILKVRYFTLMKQK